MRAISLLERATAASCMPCCPLWNWETVIPVGWLLLLLRRVLSLLLFLDCFFFFFVVVAEASFLGVAVAAAKLKLSLSLASSSIVDIISGRGGMVKAMSRTTIT